jgi:hypothetical protein
MGFCFVLSSGALLSVGHCLVILKLLSVAHLSVWRCLVIFERGLRPPYFLMAMGFCFVLPLGALLSVGRCLVIFEGGLRPPFLFTLL